MKRRLTQLIHRCLAWCPIYQMAVGGYRYYWYSQERRYRPAQFLHWGKNARLGENVLIAAPERCHIGDGAAIGSNSYINAVGGFHLGSYSGIADGSVVLTTEHRFIGAHSLPFDRMRQVKPVHIGDFVWVGARSMILSGVRIGEGAIIGMGSVVNRDVPAHAIVVGNPAVVVGQRPRDSFEKLRKGPGGRNPYDQCSILWVPPFIQRKYGDQLKEFGFDVVPGEECFLFDKFEGTLLRIENEKAEELSLPRRAGEQPSPGAEDSWAE